MRLLVGGVDPAGAEKVEWQVIRESIRTLTFTLVMQRLCGSPQHPAANSFFPFGLTHICPAVYD